MEKTLSSFTFTCPEGATVELLSQKENGGVSLYTFRLSWTKENAQKNETFACRWSVPMLDFMYRWRTCGHLDRHVQPDWGGYSRSMTASEAPVDCYYDGKGLNKYTWALDECAKKVEFKSGALEENGCLVCRFRLATAQFTNLLETTLTLRVDARGDIPMYEALADVAAWWENDCGMKAAHVPADAKAPLYSFWYSFHQNVPEAEVEAECKRAKDLGFDICIVDDGWQTGDNNRGYAFCGDWEPAPEKIKDMAAHVARVHKIGMKYILWLSVPFMGERTKSLEEFKDMMLRVEGGGLRTGVLDPRYRKVREYLLGIYVRALTEWDLDGLKLDFIDMWYDDPRNAPYAPGMDIPVLQDAVDVFMTSVVETLCRIKPEVLLEFRQSYIGPNMRKYGNMFRVGDCPNDYLSNRVGIFDLRLLMRNTAVHSDMLMWHRDEKPETAALQIVSVMFGVLQYSAKLENIPEKTAKMSRFWLAFLKEHRETLLESPLSVYEPHLLYTWAKATSKDECIAAAYAIDKCLVPDDKPTVWLANGCMGSRLLAQLSGTYRVTVFDCYGETVEEKTAAFDGIAALNVPTGGLVKLEKQA